MQVPDPYESPSSPEKSFGVGFEGFQRRVLLGVTRVLLGCRRVLKSERLQFPVINDPLCKLLLFRISVVKTIFEPLG